MRAESLRRITPQWAWDWLDTDPPLTSTSRVWQSLAYRYYTGRAVSRINARVKSWISGKALDLVWIDKAVFLNAETMKAIRGATRRLVHFTPDTAFYANSSRHFERTMDLFDLLVTTKSFDVEKYHSRLTRDTVLLTTQGFDPEVHMPRNTDVARARDAVFIGLAEPDREECIRTLISSGIPVTIAGQGWHKFARHHRRNPALSYAGESVFGADYARLLSKSWIGLGLLSKRFPEVHTTRTFEIPACGTILATERNIETQAYFGDDEALFFADHEDLAQKIVTMFDKGIEAVSAVAHAGRDRVIADRRDYPSILARILSDPRLA
jgi:spore maturation protein CgeB